jgi:tetratricopeptide (TPR) repeat protein
VANDSLGARRVAESWSAFLDGEAARAGTPEERTVFDSHRLSAYMELGQVERAIPMLQQSERDLPGDYNPPARLAAAYRALQRWDEALSASDRAMALAYGPRKLNFYELRADIFKGRGDLEGARSTLGEAIRYLESLPQEQRSATRLAALKRKLDAMPPR